MTQLSAAEAAQFAQRWLPAWTGNDPQRLAAFYSDDVLYVDPGIPAGAQTLEVVGVCLVQLDAAGKIRRNEVYFDRTELLAQIARYRQPK